MRKYNKNRSIILILCAFILTAFNIFVISLFDPAKSLLVSMLKTSPPEDFHLKVEGFSRDTENHNVEFAEVFTIYDQRINICFMVFNTPPRTTVSTKWIFNDEVFHQTEQHFEQSVKSSYACQSCSFKDQLRPGTYFVLIELHTPGKILNKTLKSFKVVR